MNFTTHQYQLISFSLVLEHIEDLNLVFREAAKATAASGYWYIGELHPFKQYTGTKARFDTADGQKEVACFTHHISAFTQLAKLHSFSIEKIDEYFDNGDKTSIPRILTLLLKKN